MAEQSRRSSTNVTHRDHPHADAEEPKREGEVLGIGDVKPDPGQPRAPRRRKGSPEGIEVGGANRNLPRSKGATGVDMGAGGEGTDIAPPRRTSDDD